jgi:hypothetical protein
MLNLNSAKKSLVSIPNNTSLDIVDAKTLLMPVGSNKKKEKNIVIEERPSNHNSSFYSLYFTRTLNKSLSGFSYIGNGYFIGVLTNDVIYDIKIYNELYKLFLNSYTGVNIIEINISESVESSKHNLVELVIIKTSDNEFLRYINPVNIITPVDFIQCEQLGNSYSCEYNGQNISFNVEKITIDSFIIDSKKELLIGTPLYCKTKLVGIFSRVENNKLIFHRISHYLEWISRFSDIIQTRHLSNLIPKNVIYTQEQLYGILSCLNEKIDNLSKQIEDKETFKQPFKELIDQNNLKNEQNVGKLLSTIIELQNKVKEQDRKINYLTDSLKKMGF